MRISRTPLAKRVEDSKWTGKVEAVCGYQAQSALREALMGNLALAKREAEEALKLSNSMYLDAKFFRAKYVQAVSAIVLGLI